MVRVRAHSLTRLAVSIRRRCFCRSLFACSAGRVQRLFSSWSAGRGRKRRQCGKRADASVRTPFYLEYVETEAARKNRKDGAVGMLLVKLHGSRIFNLGGQFSLKAFFYVCMYVHDPTITALGFRWRKFHMVKAYVMYALTQHRTFSSRYLEVFIVRLYSVLVTYTLRGFRTIRLSILSEPSIPVPSFCCLCRSLSLSTNCKLVAGVTFAARTRRLNAKESPRPELPT